MTRMIRFNRRKLLIGSLSALVVALVLLLPRILVTKQAEEQWDKTFGGPEWDIGFSVHQTTDSGYIIAGYTRSYGAGGDDIWLVKTDSKGNKEWDKTFGGSDWDGAYCVEQTSDGGYIISGYTRSYNAGIDDVWLIKTDFEGNEQWNKTFGGSDWDGAYCVEQTSDGGYIVTGWTGYYMGDPRTNVWLIKADSEGNREWDKTFGGSGWDVGHCVQQTADGGYIISGRTRSYGAGDVWLIKTDSEGNREWDKIFGGSGWDVGSYVQQTTDGGYIIAGRTTSYGAGAGDVWLIKTDSEGNREWDKTFGGSGYDVSYCVQQTADGGYIIAGETRSCRDEWGDVWLIKTDSEGNREWDKTFGGSGYDVSYCVQQTSDGGYIVTGWTRSYGVDDDLWLIKVSANPIKSGAGGQ